MSTIDTREAEEALRNLSSAFIRNTRLAMKTATVIVQRQARAKHKFRSRSGTAEASIETEVTQNSEGTTGVVEVNPKKDKKAMHAIYQHEGTGLYGPKKKAFDIFPKNKKMLRFLTSPGTAKFRMAPYGRFHEGGFTFAFGVTNPGVKGDPFLYNALSDKTSKIHEVFEEYYNKTVREAGLE